MNNKNTKITPTITITIITKSHNNKNNNNNNNNNNHNNNNNNNNNDSKNSVNMPLLRLQSSQGKFAMSAEINPVRRSFCRHGSCTFTEEARLVHSGYLLQEGSAKNNKTVLSDKSRKSRTDAKTACSISLLDGKES